MDPCGPQTLSAEAVWPSSPARPPDQLYRSRHPSTAELTREIWVQVLHGQRAVTLVRRLHDQTCGHRASAGGSASCKPHKRTSRYSVEYLYHLLASGLDFMWMRPVAGSGACYQLERRYTRQYILFCTEKQLGSDRSLAGWLPGFAGFCDRRYWKLLPANLRWRRGIHSTFVRASRSQGPSRDGGTVGDAMGFSTSHKLFF